MDIRKLTTFFLWCTIINGAILVLAIFGTILGPDFGVRMQSKLFHVPVETVNAAIYFFLGVFKIFWLILNVAPYLALLILRKKLQSA